MSWWDGHSFDRVRVLRDSLRADRNHLANAPLNQKRKAELADKIAGQEEKLKKLLAEKRRAEAKRKAPEA